jgi:hypothetical protein
MERARLRLATMIGLWGLELAISMMKSYASAGS